MNLQQLREALKAGTITLAQFKEQAKAWLAAQLTAKSMSQEDHDKELANVEAEPDPAGGGGGGGGATFTPEQQAAIDAQIKAAAEAAAQAAADRVRTEYTKKNKQTEEELEKLRREKMTDAERAADDLAKAQKELKDKEDALARREVELHTISAMAAKSIPTAFKDFLVADTIENTDKRLADFQTVWAAALKEAVEQKFKDAGGDPNKNKGGGGGGQVNPWKRETLNLTEQARILKENPTLAAQLKAAAGVK